MPEEEGGSSLLHVSISAEPLFTIGPLTVTNSMVGAVLASAILLFLTWVLPAPPARSFPGRMQSLIEWPIEWVSRHRRRAPPADGRATWRW